MWSQFTAMWLHTNSENMQGIIMCVYTSVPVYMCVHTSVYVWAYLYRSVYMMYVM